MKKYLLALCALFVFVSCASGGEKESKATSKTQKQALASAQTSVKFSDLSVAYVDASGALFLSGADGRERVQVKEQLPVMNCVFTAPHKLVYSVISNREVHFKRLSITPEGITIHPEMLATGLGTNQFVDPVYGDTPTMHFYKGEVGLEWEYNDEHNGFMKVCKTDPSLKKPLRMQGFIEFRYSSDDLSVQDSYYHTVESRSLYKEALFKAAEYIRQHPELYNWVSDPEEFEDPLEYFSEVIPHMGDVMDGDSPAVAWPKSKVKIYYTYMVGSYDVYLGGELGESPQMVMPLFISQADGSKMQLLPDTDTGLPKIKWQGEQLWYLTADQELIRRAPQDRYSYRLTKLYVTDAQTNKAHLIGSDIRYFCTAPQA